MKRKNLGLSSSKDYPLSLVIALHLAQKEHMRVLDFGGGMGFQYLELISKVPEALEKVEYYVVDGQASIENRPIELNKFSNLYFSSNLDTIIGTIDILHIGSTIQYIEDWKPLLQRLTDTYNPEYCVFSDLLAGDIPTFVTHQNFYEKKIPVTMLNINEFTGYLGKLFFTPIYQAYFQTSVLGQYELPNESLPKPYRFRHTCNIIFKKCD